MSWILYQVCVSGEDIDQLNGGWLFLAWAELTGRTCERVDEIQADLPEIECQVTTFAFETERDRGTALCMVETADQYIGWDDDSEVHYVTHQDYERFCSKNKLEL
jgi:hypothetical protein